MEGYLSYIPSSTSKNELSDISLFDHVKITAAIGGCIYEYLVAMKCDDYKKELLDNENEFYSKDAFLFLSCDVSGIQSFIYNLHSNEDVLKSLRARSFYLEIMVENLIDDLLEKTNMSRANLVYSGGGHCYLILPNTPFVEESINRFEKEFNHWLLEHFKTDLYIAFGYTKCCADDLIGKNRGEKDRDIKNIYAEVSRELSDKKNRRYSAEDIIYLNNNRAGESERECKY